MFNITFRIYWILILGSVPVGAIAAIAIVSAVLSGASHNVAPIAWLYAKVILNFMAIFILCLWRDISDDASRSKQD